MVWGDIDRINLFYRSEHFKWKKRSIKINGFELKVYPNSGSTLDFYRSVEEVHLKMVPQEIS